MEEEIITKEQLATLPEKLKQFILQNQWSTDARSIGTKSNLTPEQIDALENEVLFVLANLEPKEMFEGNIIESLPVQEATAKNLSDEIKEKIFKKVDEFLPEEAEEELPGQGGGLIEDTAGNQDNTLPPLPQVTTPPPAPVIPPIEVPPPSQISVDEKLTALASDTGAEDRVVPKQYVDKPDPYREPTN